MGTPARFREWHDNNNMYCTFDVLATLWHNKMAISAVRAVCSLAALAASVGGHGMLVSPPARNAIDRFLPQFKDGQSPQT